MEPLKKVQVEGHLMFAEPQDLFGNLDELCYVRLFSCSVALENRPMRQRLALCSAYNTFCHWRGLHRRRHLRLSHTSVLSRSKKKLTHTSR